MRAFRWKISLRYCNRAVAERIQRVAQFWHVSIRWLIGIGFSVLFGIGIGIVGVEEFGLALIYWLVPSIVLAAIFWPRPQNRWPNLWRIGACVASLTFFSIMSIWTFAKKGDDPWTNLVKLAPLWETEVLDLEALNAWRTVPAPPRSLAPALGDARREANAGIALALTPHVIAYRRFAGDGRQLLTHYGFSVVLYARNDSPTPRHIRRIEVVGDAMADFVDYMGAFRDKRSMQEMEREFTRHQPYRRLHWIANPIGSGRVESNGEEKYIKFRFVEPEGLGLRVFTGSKIDYFGYASTGTQPRTFTTSPHLQDVIVFRRLTDSDPKEAIAPQLRREVVAGKVVFRILVDSETITVKPENINAALWTLRPDWEEGNPADLFQGLSGTSFDRIDRPAPGRRQ